MQGDTKVIDYRNRATRSELTAVSQDWLHDRLQDAWGLTHMAAKSRAESIEEMQHADRLIARIIFLEGHPNLQKLAPLRIGQTPLETMQCDLAAEKEARALYDEAREYCSKVGDIVTMKLFEEIATDEKGHIDFLETQIALHERLGAERFMQLNAGTFNQARDHADPPPASDRRASGRRGHVV